MRAYRSLLVLLLMCVSCIGPNPDIRPNSGDMASSDGPAVGDGSQPDLSSSAIMCPAVFPTFDKTCGDTKDCAVAMHQINCCGSERAIGINLGEQKRFDAAEAICRAQYPGCGCASQPPVAEDGHSADDPSNIGVECQRGKCMSYVKTTVRPRVVGSPCTADHECETKQCLKETEQKEFVGGYCTVKACDDMLNPCPTGSECRGNSNDGTQFCLSLCMSTRCRETYRCCGPGPSARWCAPQEHWVCRLR